MCPVGAPQRVSRPADERSQPTVSQPRLLLDIKTMLLESEAGIS